jgi:Ni,Fe-hydrogenase III large subunit/Ni,Fe-hydrogenase III component G
MANILKETAKLLEGAAKYDTTSERSGEYYIAIDERYFPETINRLSGAGYSLVSLFCVEGFEGEALSLLYSFEKRGAEGMLFLVRGTAGGVTSIADIYPSASWYEREARDGFGVEFEGTFDKRRLFLHEAYPENFHPLQKLFVNGPMRMGEPAAEYPFKRVAGEGVYQIPVGPVHAGVIEPGHFRFSVIGESIFSLELRLFWKHRGVEKLAEGRAPGECVKIAESISGDESASNAVAYCLAAEKIAGATIPERGWALRTVYLELERVYALLGDLAGMVVDVAYPAGASPFFILREEILRWNATLTGSRFLKDAVCLGGVTGDVDDDRLTKLSLYLDTFQRKFTEARKHNASNPTVVDRFETTGVLKQRLVPLLNVTGPAARASGVSMDVRVDHPYGLYPSLGVDVVTHESGDVMARFLQKSDEVLASVRLISALAENMPKGECVTEVKMRSGFACGVVESPRGQNFHWLRVKNGVVNRYKVRTASYCNWQAMEHAVPGNIVPDFPLVNKSFNLSYAGTDL